MKTIKLGDPVPEPCKNCGIMYGYQVNDSVRGLYTMIHNGDGSVYGGAYADSMKTTSTGKRAYCSNCGHDLKIKVDRNHE